MKNPLWQPSRVKTLVFSPFDCPLQHVEETTTTTSGFSVFGPRAMKNASPSLPPSLFLCFARKSIDPCVHANLLFLRPAHRRDTVVFYKCPNACFPPRRAPHVQNYCAHYRGHCQNRGLVRACPNKHVPGSPDKQAEMSNPRVWRNTGDAYLGKRVYLSRQASPNKQSESPSSLPKFFLFGASLSVLRVPRPLKNPSSSQSF